MWTLQFLVDLWPQMRSPAVNESNQDAMRQKTRKGEEAYW